MSKSDDNQGELSSNQTATFGDGSDHTGGGMTSSGEKENASPAIGGGSISDRRGRSRDEQQSPKTLTYEIVTRELTPAGKRGPEDDGGKPPKSGKSSPKSPKSPKSSKSSKSPKSAPERKATARSRSPPTRSRSTAPAEPEGKSVPDLVRHFNIGSGRSTPRSGSIPVRPPSETVEGTRRSKGEAPKALKQGGERLQSSSSDGLSSYVNLTLPVVEAGQVDEEHEARERAMSGELALLKGELARLRTALDLKDDEVKSQRRASAEEINQIKQLSEFSEQVKVSIAHSLADSEVKTANQQMYEAAEMFSAECRETTKLKLELDAQKQHCSDELEKAMARQVLSHQQGVFFKDQINLLERREEEQTRLLNIAAQKIESLSNHNLGNDAKVETLTLELQQCKAGRGSLEARLDAEIDRSRQKDESLEKLRREVFDLKQDINTKAQLFDSQMKMASDKLSEAGLRVDALQSEVEERNKTISEMRQEALRIVPDNSQSLKVLEIQIQSLTRDVERLTHEKVQLERTIDSLKASAEVCEQRNSDLTKEANQYYEDRKNCWNKNAELHKEMEDLRKSYKAEQTERTALHDRIKQLELQLDEYQADKSELETRLRVQAARLDEFEKGNAQRDVDHSKKVRTVIDDCEASAHKMNDEFEKRMKAMSHDWEMRQKSWISRAVEMQEENEHLQFQISELQDLVNSDPKSKPVKGTKAETSEEPEGQKTASSTKRSDPPKKGDPSGDPDGDGDGGPPGDGGKGDKKGEDSSSEEDESSDDDEDDDNDGTKGGEKSDVEELRKDLNKVTSAMKKFMEKSRKKKKKRGDDSSSDDDSTFGALETTGDSDKSRVVVRKTDVEKVIVPKFPHIGDVPVWKQNVARNLTVATGRIDYKEISWINEVQKVGQTMEGLADSGKGKRFKQLDIRLAVSLVACVKEGCPELNRTIQRKENELMEAKGQCLRGRQIMWLILDYFKTNQEMSVVYTVQDLTGLEWLGDKNMHTFKYFWDTMVARMRSEFSEATLSEILVGKLEKSVELKEDIRHYQRSPAGHPDRSYHYLLSCMDRHLARQRLYKNRQDNQLAMKKHGAAPAPPEDPKKKKKKKKKSKKGDQSETEAEEAAPGPEKPKKPRKKGSGKGGSSDEDPRRKKACIYFQRNECKRGKDCPFKHKKVSPEELEKLTKGRGRSSSPATKDPKEKPPREKSAPKMGYYCHAFITPKGCTKGSDCKFPHLNEAAVEEMKRAHKAAMAEYNKKNAKKT